MNTRRVVGWLIACAAALSLSAAPAAAFAPPVNAPLPDFDVRADVKPPDKLATAQDKLADRLGEEGFADPAEPLGTTGFVGRTDGFLTAASDASARRVALDYVADNSKAFGLDGDDLDALELTDGYTSLDGVTHLTWSQMTRGIPSYDTYLNANVTADGRLINLTGGPVGDLELGSSDPDLGGHEALNLARESVGGTAGPGFGDQESAELVAFATGSDAKLAWRTYADGADSLLYEVVVNASSGRVLARQSRTDFLNQASIWQDHPSTLVAPTTVNLGADASWIDDTAGNTRLGGNNTRTYADVNGNNVADAAEEVAQVAGDWLFPITFFNQAECPPFLCTWDSTNVATKATNQKQTTTQLFYFVNKFHDHLLAPPIGFDEASRNFERVNSSGLGLGGDAVNAEANDGGGINNANFATPADGGAPRMQMYFFNNNWDVTSSDDADVVYHEYTHGMTNRILGNGAGLGAMQSGSMGEAWSDWYAKDFVVDEGLETDTAGPNLVLGGYSINLFGQGGIRHQEIDCKVSSSAVDCPGSGTAGPGGYTFGDLGKVGNATGVHDNGEIWAETLWDLRDAVGSVRARALVTGGLRLSPNNPTFLQMRNAILQSAVTLGEPRDPIWAVFAGRGMGYSATTPGATSNVAVEAFDLPPAMIHKQTDIADPVPLGDGDGLLEPGETVKVTSTLEQLRDAPISGVSGSISTTNADALLGTDSSAWPNFSASGVMHANDPPFSVTIPATTSCFGTVDVVFDVAFGATAVAVPTKSIPIGGPLFQSASPALPIPDNVPAGVNATMTLPAGTVGNIDVKLDQLTHTFNGDLKITLKSPTGTIRILTNRRGGTSDGFQNLIFDDDAAASITTIPTSGGPVSGTFRPEETLAAFTGEPAAGDWIMNVSDNAGDRHRHAQHLEHQPANRVLDDRGCPADRRHRSGHRGRPRFSHSRLDDRPEGHRHRLRVRVRDHDRLRQPHDSGGRRQRGRWSGEDHPRGRPRAHDHLPLPGARAAGGDRDRPRHGPGVHDHRAHCPAGSAARQSRRSRTATMPARRRRPS